jgi:trimeric autotransporter adhesin
MSITRFVCFCVACLGTILPLAAQTTSAAQTSSMEPSATVQVPRLIRFSGNLSMPSPAFATGGVVNVTFSLYKEDSGGMSLWQETQNVEVDATGHYTALLGTMQAEGLPIDLFTSGQAQWLAVRPQGQAEQPRIMLVSVPFALKAGDAETFGGKPPSAYATAVPATATNSRSSANSISSLSSRTAGTVASTLGSRAKNSAATPGQITGSGTPNYIPVWSSSSNLTMSPLYQQGLYIGYGTTTPQGPLDIRGGTAIFAIPGLTTKPKTAGLFGFNDQNVGEGFGILGNTSSSIGGAGIYGLASSTTGPVVGVDGETNSSDGAGVFGVAAEATGVEGQTQSAASYGGLFVNQSTQTILADRAIALGAINGAHGGIALDSVAVEGSATGRQQTQVTGSTLGIWGDTNQTSGIGVLGTVDDGQGVVGLNNDPNLAAGSFTNYDTTATGAGIGVTGTTTSPNGGGVYGFITSSSSDSVGVVGDNFSTTGSGYGVYGSSASSSGYAVAGINYDTTGSGEGGIGVDGVTTSPNGVGVYGYASATTGVSYGVYGNATTGPGVYGESTGDSGIVGYSTSTQANGVSGVSGATSGYANGIYGSTDSPAGVAGFFDNIGGGYILVGIVNGNPEHMFHVDGAGDGYFAGDVQIDGTLSKGGGSFKIDHPLDPANKYLYHSFVESPDMMNIYNGNTTTDGGGLATVQLPEWFEALNRDFRYQLTVMGQFAQAIVADKVANHQFRIKTDKPNVEVSWQVTGIRQDAFANAHRIQVEVDKAPEDRGHYLHPELFGASQEARISHHAGSGENAHNRPVYRPAFRPATQRSINASRAQHGPSAPASGKVLLPPPMPRVLPVPTMPKALTAEKAQK